MQKQKTKKNRTVIIILFICAIASASYFVYDYLKKESIKRQQIEELYSNIEKNLSSEEWNKAEEALDKLTQYSPENSKLQSYIRDIKAGKRKEIEQLFSIKKSLLKENIENGKWKSSGTLLEELKEILSDLDKEDVLVAEYKSIKKHLESKKIEILINTYRESEDIENLIKSINLLEKVNPEFSNIKTLRKEREQAIITLDNRKKEARSLYEKALNMDTGKYSEEALTILGEARSIYEDKDIIKLYHKFYSYPKTIFLKANQAEESSQIVNSLRPGDIIKLEKGTYKYGLQIKHGIKILGEGKGETTFEGQDPNSPIIYVNGSNTDKKTEIIGFTLKHAKLVNDSERASAIIINSGEAAIKDIDIIKANGHGIAITNGAKASIINTEIKQSGWDGISIFGEHSKAEIKNVTCAQNYHHGIDAWNGGTVFIYNSIMEKNTYTGLQISTKDLKSFITKSKIIENNEVGINIQNKAQLLIEECIIKKNRLGGIYSKTKGNKVSIKKCSITKNSVAGLIAKKGSECIYDNDTVINNNQGKDLWLDFEK